MCFQWKEFYVFLSPFSLTDRCISLLCILQVGDINSSLFSCRGLEMASVDGLQVGDCSVEEPLLWSRHLWALLGSVLLHVACLAAGAGCGSLKRGPGWGSSSAAATIEGSARLAGWYIVSFWKMLPCSPKLITVKPLQAKYLYGIAVLQRLQLHVVCVCDFKMYSTLFYNQSSSYAYCTGEDNECAVICSCFSTV